MMIGVLGDRDIRIILTSSIQVEENIALEYVFNEARTRAGDFNMRCIGIVTNNQAIDLAIHRS